MKKTIFLFLLVLVVSSCSLTPSDKETTKPETETTNPDNGEQISRPSEDDKETVIDYGTLSIKNIIMYVDDVVTPTVTFSNPEYECEITYTFDATCITYENGVFKAVSIGEEIVTAKTEYHETQFMITVKANEYANKMNQKEAYWQANGAKTGGTIFVGDSFFDTQFWSNFYTTYEGENTYTNAISATTTTDWERMVGRLLYPMEPENVVIHCGTNNIYDDKENAQTVIENTKKLLDKIHTNLPQAKIYYFAIEPRTYGLNGAVTFDQYTFNIIDTVNKAMKAYCSENDYMIYLDVTSQCYTDGIEVNANFFRDGIHPTIENYGVYVEALKEAGLVLKTNSNTTSLEFAVNSVVTDIKGINEYSIPLTNNYRLSGTINITAANNNAHIQFGFITDDYNNRFLLWDDDNNGTYAIKGISNGRYGINPSKNYLTKGMPFDFELIATNRNAYLYINNELELIFRNVNPKNLLIGAEACACEFYDLSITSQRFNPTGFNEVLNRNVIAEHEANLDTTKEMIVVNMEKVAPTTQYSSQITAKENAWKNNGGLTGGTIFIGDSFFDTAFWSNFYTMYEGFNAYTTGIGSTTTTDWEEFVDRLLYPMNPKNVVIHCGTNNFYDDWESPSTVIENTKRLLESIHTNLPQAKIYYFAIEPRVYGMYGSNSFDTTSYNSLKQVNTTMQEYCENNDFMVYVDVTNYCYTSGMIVNAGFFSDGTHPKLANYELYNQALLAAGLVFEPIVDTSSTTDFAFAATDKVGSAINVKQNGTILSNNYSVKGTLKINNTNGNPHIQFMFKAGDFGNRFLLWDQDNNGTYNIRCAVGGNYDLINVQTVLSKNDVINFEIVTSNKHAYLYINGVLELIFLNLNPETLLIESENAACNFSLTEIISQAHNETEFANVLARAEIAKYENGNYTSMQVVYHS